MVGRTYITFENHCGDWGDPPSIRVSRGTFEKFVELSSFCEVGFRYETTVVCQSTMAAHWNNNFRCHRLWISYTSIVSRREWHITSLSICRYDQHHNYCIMSHTCGSSSTWLLDRCSETVLSPFPKSIHTTYLRFYKKKSPGLIALQSVFTFNDRGSLL